MHIDKQKDTTVEKSKTFTYNIPLVGSLKIKKVASQNQQIALQGVGFKVKNTNTGLWVKRDSNGNISYVSESQATEFVTNSNGEISISNLYEGTYQVFETKNPNYGYEVENNGAQVTVYTGQTSTVTVLNKQKYIRITGYVWLDNPYEEGKVEKRNDLYRDNSTDNKDQLLSGITVRLKEKNTNNTVKTVTTNNGNYEFTDVVTDNISNYYVEFEYDGLTYTNVTPNLSKTNGSKAKENATDRDNLNKGFSLVEGDTARNTGHTLDQNGNRKHNLTYTLNSNSHTATLNNQKQFPITSNIKETSYNLQDYYQVGQATISNVNLGLYLREQPDLAIMKDLQNVRLGVNGYQHVYEYAQRFVNQGEYGDGFNVGVKFGNKYGSMSYTRPIYKADYEYTSEDKSKELQVYLTYRISIKNLSTNLKVKAGSILDYYDSNYELIAVGTGINERGEITGNLNRSQEENYNADYKKITINTNYTLDPQSKGDLYVQFRLNREAVIRIINDQETLENVTEINSYSTYDSNGNIYAGIDKNSAPANAVPGDKSTYEDDTDWSPSLKLEVAEARRMTGKVFVDSTTGDLTPNQVRQGSGAYEEGEEGVGGVEVTLTENKEDGKIYRTTTATKTATYGLLEEQNQENPNQLDLTLEEYNESNKDNYIRVEELEKGEYLLGDFIPGDYTISYTWGDDEYTVQKYKGTVVNKEVWDAKQMQANKEWYKDEFKKNYPNIEWNTSNNTEIRTSDAIDNYETRREIDEELKEFRFNTVTTKEKMTSTTPLLGVGVEYDTTTTASSGDKYEYEISSIDFGIVERARQELTTTKNIRKLKISLADGRVIADATVNEDGTLSGESSSVVYIKPPEGGNTSDGILKAELDNELLQSATVNAEYEITIKNNSELDYLSEEFYHYGIVSGNLVEMEAAEIIDYANKGWNFTPEGNTDWEVKQISELNGIVAEDVYKSSDSTIGNTTILFTKKLEGVNLEPNESSSVAIKFGKMLTSTDEAAFYNETEIILIRKTGGGIITSTPGNYIPGTGKTEVDDDTAEDVVIVPSTGANLAYVIPITIGVVSFTILGVGIVLIKKKILGN